MSCILDNRRAENNVVKVVRVVREGEEAVGDPSSLSGKNASLPAITSLIASANHSEYSRDESATG